MKAQRSEVPNLAAINLGLLLIYMVYYFIKGISTIPVDINEIDSLTYHIPLAESISQLNFTDLDHIKQGLGYYPAMGESILAVLNMTLFLPNLPHKPKIIVFALCMLFIFKVIFHLRARHE